MNISIFIKYKIIAIPNASIKVLNIIKIIKLKDLNVPLWTFKIIKIILFKRLIIYNI